MSLGKWIVASCEIENFTMEANFLLFLIKIPPELYQVEMICLSAFAAQASFRCALDDEMKSQQLLEQALLEIKQCISAQSSLSEIFDRILPGRLDVYQRAQEVDLRGDPAAISLVGEKFLSFITPPPDDDIKSEVDAVGSPAFKNLQRRAYACKRLTEIAMELYPRTEQKVMKQLAIELG